MKCPTCPKCGYEFDEECSDFVSYWGDETVTADCPQCDAKLSVDEHLQRTWTVRVRDSVPAASPA